MAKPERTEEANGYELDFSQQDPSVTIPRHGHKKKAFQMP